MVLLLKTAALKYLHLINDLSDPRTKEWFLCGSPVPIIFLMVTYWATVTHWLPTFMKTRQPYNLRRVIIGYNLLQVASCVLLLCKGFPSCHKIMNYACIPIDFSDNPHAINIAECTWWYYMLKVVDLLDTIFFSLRKKIGHVSYLHVYHHTGMLLLGYAGATFLTGGESIYVGFINSIVHAIMYSYYLYAAWKPQDRNLILTFKKFVTQLQLLQFVTLFCILTPKIFTDCAFPKFPLMIFCPQLLIMMLMFGDFYYKTYIKGKGMGSRSKDVNGMHTKADENQNYNSSKAL